MTETKRYFERTGPVDATLERVFVPPVFELEEDVLAVRFVAGEHSGLGEQDKMLVTIDFPNELVIAGSSEVEIWNPAEIACRCFDTAVRVATPGNLVAVIDHTIEERNMPAHDFVRYRNQIAGIVGVAQYVGDSGWIRKSLERRVSMQRPLRRRQGEERVGGLLAQTELYFASRAHGNTMIDESLMAASFDLQN